MKHNYKTDPAITFDHIHTDSGSRNEVSNKINGQRILFILEIVVLLSLLGFMILLLN